MAAAFLVVCGLLGWFVIAPAGAAGGQGTSGPDASAEQQFVSKINNLRASKGLPPMQLDSELVSIGRRWSTTMAEAGDIWHNPNYSDWVTNPNWTLLGENVGVGPDVNTLFQAFVDSPGHYKNLVESRFNRIGVGVIWGDDGSMYTSHQFMSVPESPPPPPPPPPPTAPPTTAPPATAPAVTAPAVTSPPATSATSPPTTSSPVEAQPQAVPQLPTMLQNLRALDQLAAF